MPYRSALYSRQLVFSRQMGFLMVCLDSQVNQERDFIGARTTHCFRWDAAKAVYSVKHGSSPAESIQGAPTPMRFRR